MTFSIQRLAAITVVSILTACSSVKEREIASGSFEYTEETPGQRILIPSDTDAPKFSDAYKLPELGTEAQQVILGEELSILSPALVLPLVTGSHVEEGSKQATVWFDQIDDSQALDTTIWNSLIKFMEEQGIGVQTFDKDTQSLVSDWMVVNESTESKWYSWSSSERSVGQRFEFKLSLKPHGRTAALNVDLVDYKEQESAQGPVITQSRDERRQEVEILNKVVEHYEYEVRVANAKRIRKIREGLAMELGFDADGEPAFVVDGKYDIAWPRLLLVLRKLGFDVKDYDKSNGLLFVKYNGLEGSGWWSDLWSDDENSLDLDTQEYRFKVGASGPKTSITMLDEESKPFPANKLTDLYPTFSKTMSADDLDI